MMSKEQASRGTVLITGCSSGIGLATCLVLAERGWTIVPTMRDPERGQALRQAMQQAGLKVPEILALDVTDPVSISAAVAQAPPLDALVSNAGTGDGGCFEDFDDVHCRRIMETNFYGSLMLARTILPQMRERGSGRLVLVTSIAGYSGVPGGTMYSASKFALEGWAEALTLEVEPFGISVSIVEPGFHNTSVFQNQTIATRPNSPYAALTARIAAIPVGDQSKRAGDPRRVGTAIAHALESKHPRLRYPVGPDAVLVSLMRRLLPDRWRLGLVFGGSGMLGWHAEQPHERAPPGRRGPVRSRS